MIKLPNSKRTGIIIALIVAIALTMMHRSRVKIFEILELKTLDLECALRGPLAPGPETVIAAIDEKSISRLGRFPWPRATWGRIVDRMTDEGARVVVFDVFFSEPENAASDDAFERAIRRNGRVILPMVFD